MSDSPACNGIVPSSLGTPVRLPVVGVELSPATDEAGAALVGHYTRDSPPFAPQYDFFADVNGQAQNVGSFAGGDESLFAVYGEPSGFMVAAFGAPNSFSLEAYNHSGDLLGTATLRDGNQDLPSWFAFPPNGGAYIVQMGAGTGPAPLSLGYFDTSAVRRFWITVSPRANNIVGIEVSQTSNHAFVIWQQLNEESGTFHARWYDETGHAITPEFTFLSLSHDYYNFQRLNDGAIVLFGQSSGQSTVGMGLFADGSTSPAPIPSWVRYNLSTIRGGRGYAQFSTGCGTNGLVLLANDGTDCACILPRAPDDSISSDYWLTRDGSVFYVHGENGRQVEDWYSALLK